jgi:3-oxoacyl-[acyl-carrier protein] reductase
MGIGGRVAVVTGAGRGLGGQIARTLLAEGCSVVACSRTAADLEALRAHETEDAAVLTVPLDVTVPEAPERLVDGALERFGRLDVLVNAAGGASPTRLDRMTGDAWRSAFATDFFAAAELAVAAVEPMRAAGWGRIVNVASTYGREPDPHYAAYGAAKAAIINLTKSFARAFSADGVTTNCVLPGVTLTEGVEAVIASVVAKTGATRAEVLDATMAKDPVAAGRFGRPEDIAAAVCFLASEAAGWISGACLAVDGSTLRVAP